MMPGGQESRLPGCLVDDSMLCLYPCRSPRKRRSPPPSRAAQPARSISPRSSSRLPARRLSCLLDTTYLSRSSRSPGFVLLSSHLNALSRGESRRCKKEQQNRNHRRERGTERSEKPEALSSATSPPRCTYCWILSPRGVGVGRDGVTRVDGERE